jgi:CBS domain-containing protein
MKARDVMTSPVVTARPETPVADIASLLLEKRISGVPIVGDRGEVVGIVSEVDLVRRVETGTERKRSRWFETLIDPNIRAADYARSRGLCARDVMSREVISVTSETDLAEVARVLEVHRIKRVPVIDGGRLAGIVSRANLLHGLVAYGARAASGQQSDRDIGAAVEARLADLSWLDASRLNTVVNDGVVHLWGALKSDEQRRALEIAVQGVPGVRAVENHTRRDTFAES